jgi:hypothetical protein
MKLSALAGALRTRAADRRGVALPLALIGLVVISLLVATALVTSGSEFALSRASGDATTSLYATSGLIDQYVAANVGALANDTTTMTGGDGKSYRVIAAALGTYRSTAATNPYSFQIYSISAERATGGRRVVAMVRAPVKLVNFTASIQAGASLGQDATIGGSIAINDSSALCNGAASKWAIVHAAGTALTVNGAAGGNIGGDTATFAGTRDSLAKSIMSSVNLNDLANSATIKFGRKFGQPAFNGSPSATNSSTSYRWGCPSDMVTGCASRDTSYYPLVAIDASNADGTAGTVDINGDYGQGMLVVINGNLRLQGNFVYKGIVLVEGSTDIHGGGQNGSKIEGALLGFGNLNICTSSTTNCLDTTTFGNGTGNTQIESGTVIDYNRCAITAVENSINAHPIQLPVTRSPYAWTEIVR